MKAILLLLTASVLVATAGCGDDNPMSSSASNRELTSDLSEEGPFALKFDQPLDIASEQLQITLQNVGDSRCAEGATCVWEGQVSITIGVEKNGRDMGSFDINLHVGDEDRAFAAVEGHAIYLTDVEPFPEYGVKPERSEYVATLAVEELAVSAPDRGRWSLEGWLDGEYAEDLDEDGDIDAEDFTLFVNQRPADGGPGPADSLPELAFESLARGDSHAAGVEKPALIVAGDDSEVARIAEWVEDAELAAEIREIDFSTTWVIAVFRGLVNTGGYGIETRAIHLEDGSVRLIVELADPAEDQAVAQVISYLYHVVAVPREELQLSPGTTVSALTAEGKLLVAAPVPLARTLETEF